MKLLLDQGTPRSTATLLRQAGWDAVHTGEIGMAESADEEILKRALIENRIVVTLDAEIASKSYPPMPGRLEDRRDDFRQRFSNSCPSPANWLIKFLMAHIHEKIDFHCHHLRRQAAFDYADFWE